MKTETIYDNTLEAVRNIVRGFFCGYMSGMLDRRQPEWRQRKDAKIVKQVAAEAYEHFASHFGSVAKVRG